MRVYGLVCVGVGVIGCFRPVHSAPSDDTTGTESESGSATTPTGSTAATAATTTTGNTESMTDPPTTSEASTESDGSVCGNGEVETGEVCDDGVNDGSYGGCGEDCTELGPRCGDGVLHGNEGEVCDDGDEVNGDGCNIDCIESATILWTETYSTNIGGSQDHPWDVHVGDDGTILVTGYVSGAGGVASGILLWYDGDGLLLEDLTPSVAYRRARLGGPGYVLLESGTNEDSPAVVAFDSAHALAWRRPLGATLADLALDADSNVYVAGDHQVTAGTHGLYRAKLDADGDVIWEERDAADAEFTGCFDVALLPNDASLFLCDSTRWVDADGNEVAELAQNLSVLETQGDGTYAGAVGGTVVAFDDAGAELWNVPAGLFIEDIAVDGAGNFVTAGRGDVAKYSPDGTQLWTATHDADVYNVAIAPDDAIVVAGTYENADDDVWVRKYAP